jgi:hypothetical protein
MLPPEKKDLANDLLERAKLCGLKARRCYYFAFAVALLSLVASILTSVSVAIEWLPKALNAVLAAVPAIAVTLMAVFKFEEWRDWWSDRYHKLDALCRGLLYEGRHESEISKEMTDFLASHERMRPRLGNPIASRPEEEVPGRQK